MAEYLDFVSVDMWTTIFAWINLLILFLLLKHFLFDRINKVLDERASEIENTYKEAEDTRLSAEETRASYEEKLKNANLEADSIIKSAVENADARSEAIVDEASQKARGIIEKSQRQAESDKQSAIDAARGEIASMAVDVAKKLIEKEIDSGDDEKLISDIIDRM